MDHLSVENVEDIVEKDGSMTGKEFLQKCQTLEDVETSMYHNRKDTAKLNIKYRYSKDELLKLRTHPLSTKPPSLQENLKFLLGTSKSKEREEIDLKKNLVKKHGLTRNLEGVANEKYDLKKNDNPRNGEKPIISRNEGIDEIRKSADPKERIRKEQDICLSPQRKSFTTGCYVANVKNENAANNSNASNNNKANNENTGRENRENRDSRDTRDVRDPRDGRDTREIRDSREIREMRDNRDSRDNKNFREGSRRIGSGRIISRDPRFEIRGYPDSDYSRPSYYGKEKIPTVVYERKFPANFDKEKDNKFWDRQRSFNYYDKRRSHDYRDDEEEEPEWMKDGPVSLDDVIELKGFDENDERTFRFNRNSKINTRVFHKSFTNNSNNRSPTAGNPKNRMDKRNSDSDNSSVASDSLASKHDDNDSSSKSNDNETDKQRTAEKPQKKEGNDVKNVENSMHFNLEEILKLDPLPDISENVDTESAGSKFTRWFKRDDALPSNVMNGEPIPGVTKMGLIPSSSNLPGELARAQNVGGSNIHALNNQSSGSNLLELLRGSQENNTNSRADMRTLEATGKLHSVEEIEAKLRGTDNASGNPNSPNDKKKKEEETEAFKKLLSQAFHFDKSSNEGSSQEIGFSQKFERGDNGDGKIDLASAISNGENQSNPSMNVPLQMSRLPPQMNNIQQSAEKLKFLQMQQNKQQQEILSKVLMSSSPSATFSVPPPTSNVRPTSCAPNNSPFIHVAQEIQNMISAVQPTRELMQRPETVNILRALKAGEVSHYQLIEQLKKLTPYQAKFRESLLCVLKLIQMPYCNSAPVFGSPASVPFNVVHPPLSTAQPYTENIIQQMMLNSQYRVNGPQPHNGMSNIVYQRDFPSPNQNMYQNTPIKKHLVEQSPNIGQNVPRMNSPTSILSSPVSVSVSGGNVTNATNSMVLSPDDANKTTSTTQSLSFTPTSVLRKLSAEKENLDTFSKETKDPKGEKNTLIPYTSNANNSSSLCSNQGTVDHFNGFGTCIPPPAISGQYFVGNMIRPASISAQVPLFGNPPPPVLSRLPVPSNSSTAPRDANISLVGFGNQNISSRNAPMNGTLSSAEEQMARWFSSDGVNVTQSRYVMAQSMGVPGASLQNMMSVEEIERVQQSVRN